MTNTIPVREFHAVPAERKPQKLFIGIVGPSSSGKTYTALELAMGIQSVFGGEIAGIDTENNRMLAYADIFRKPDRSPGFIHIPFEPPWGSLDYIAALQYAAKQAKTIIVDSASHEHEGVGGMLDLQEQELERLSKGEEWRKQAMNMLAWQKPKAHRRQLLQTITRLDANVIMCFRAKNSSKPGRDEKGKSIVIPMGFVPIAGDEFVYEMALSALLLPGARGVPIWEPENVGERIAVKIPAQFEWLREQKGPLNREIGRQLAQWAQGTQQKAASASKPSPAAEQPPPPETAPADAPLRTDGPFILIRGKADGGKMELATAEDFLAAYERYAPTVTEDVWPKFWKANRAVLEHPEIAPRVAQIEGRKAA